MHQGLSELNDFKPDVIIAMGGGSPMDAAKVRGGCYAEHGIALGRGPQQLILLQPWLKGLTTYQHLHLLSMLFISAALALTPPQLMWLMYEIPDASLERLVTRTMDMRSE